MNKLLISIAHSLLFTLPLLILSQTTTAQLNCNNLYGLIEPESDMLFVEAWEFVNGINSPDDRYVFSNGESSLQINFPYP